MSIRHSSLARVAACLIAAVGLAAPIHASAGPSNFSNGQHTISVTPHVDLAAVEDVVVEGTAWPAGQRVRAGLCPRTAPAENPDDPAACQELAQTTTDVDGSFSLTVTIRRSFDTTTVRTSSPTTYTCEPADDCFIHVNNWFTDSGQTNPNRFQTPQLWADQALSFAP